MRKAARELRHRDGWLRGRCGGRRESILSFRHCSLFLYVERPPKNSWPLRPSPPPRRTFAAALFLDFRRRKRNKTSAKSTTRRAGFRIIALWPELWSYTSFVWNVTIFYFSLSFSHSKETVSEKSPSKPIFLVDFRKLCVDYEKDISIAFLSDLPRIESNVWYEFNPY